MKYLKAYEDFLKPEVENNEITEMGIHDWKVELILATYNKADDAGKKAMAKTITGKESSNLVKIVAQLRSLIKPEIDELTTELGLDEAANESLNESASFGDYEKAIKSHDWYYQMSDSSRTYDRGEDEIRNIKKIYADLDDSDKKKAFGIWADLYKKKYPDSDYAKGIKQNDFKGY